jgi:segregation and condensation protein B
VDQNKLVNIIKAIMLSQEKYISIDDLEQAFVPEDKVTRDLIKKAIHKISEKDDPIYELVKLAGEYNIKIKLEHNPWIKRFKGECKEELPRALLETLSIIAYKQPISRGEIALVRGCETHLTVYQQLEERGWIRGADLGGESGRALLYATTKIFLQYFGLNGIQELPELENVEEANSSLF